MVFTNCCDSATASKVYINRDALSLSLYHDSLYSVTSFIRFVSQLAQKEERKIRSLLIFSSFNIEYLDTRWVLID